MRFSPDELRRVARAVFLAMGVDGEGAVWMAETLVRANLQGHDSHGVIRIPQYYASWRNGDVDPAARPRVVVQGTATALLDGQRGFGQIVAREAMALCLKMAGKVGLAAVGVHNCYHIGRLADYVEMAAARDMAAFMFVNGGGGGQWVAPWGGRAPRLSTNPLAFACPTESRVPLSLDISTAMAPEGVVRVKCNRREQVPPGWLIDAEGQPATDPNVLYGEPRGAILPFGGHKGYGLALMVEVLAGVLSRAGHVREHADAVGNGAFLMALDITRFLSVEEFRAHVGELIQYVKGSPPAPGFLQVLRPGEPEVLAEREQTASGVFVEEETWSQIVAVARELGVLV